MDERPSCGFRNEPADRFCGNCGNAPRHARPTGPGRPAKDGDLPQGRATARARDPVPDIEQVVEGVARGVTLRQQPIGPGAQLTARRQLT